MMKLLGNKYKYYSKEYKICNRIFICFTIIWEFNIEIDFHKLVQRYKII